MRFLKLFLDQLGMGDGFVANLHEDLHPEAVHRVAHAIDVALTFHEPIDPAVLGDVQRTFILCEPA